MESNNASGQKGRAISDRDDSLLTRRRKEKLKNKPFLMGIYREWYQRIAENLPAGPHPVLEIGSGPGFAKNHIPNLITSEIFFLNEIRVVLDGQRLPFRDNAFKAIAMTDVLHHIPCARDFFREAARCIHVGGRMVMIEPWVTTWSKIVFRLVDHEPFDTDAVNWEFKSRTPIGSANGALPWIIFKRDFAIFNKEFPQWKLIAIQPFMPLRYILSGGFSRTGIMPDRFFGFWKWFEKRIEPLNSHVALFALIILEKKAV